jgi:hypothetical protein
LQCPWKNGACRVAVRLVRDLITERFFDGSR